jgi:hypothetical protein
MAVSGQLRPQAASSPGKVPLVSVVWEAEWVPEPVWKLRKREHTCIYRESNPDSPIENNNNNNEEYLIINGSPVIELWLGQVIILYEKCKINSGIQILEYCVKCEVSRCG